MEEGSGGFCEAFSAPFYIYELVIAIIVAFVWLASRLAIQSGIRSFVALVKIDNSR